MVCDVKQNFKQDLEKDFWALSRNICKSLSKSWLSFLDKYDTLANISQNPFVTLFAI